MQSTKAVYNRIIDLKIATPQIIINYGLFLEEHNYFEEAFKVRATADRPASVLWPGMDSYVTSPQAYERGVALFKWPHVYDIWNTYLTKFINRYVSLPSPHIPLSSPLVSPSPPVGWKEAGESQGPV